MFHPTVPILSFITTDQNSLLCQSSFEVRAVKKMYFDDENSLISLEEVDQALAEIENKYSPIKRCDIENEVTSEIQILSKELDTVGLPVLNITKPLDSLLKDVVASSRSLIHLYRKSLSTITDVELENQAKNRRIAELYKLIDEYKAKIGKNESKGSNLENKLVFTQNENNDLIKKESMLKEEMEKIKRYHKSKHDEILLQYKKLAKENQRLKKMCEKEASHSKDDVLVQMLGKYRKNEEIYKGTIQKLHKNNQLLMGEILELKQAQSSKLPTTH